MKTPTTYATSLRQIFTPGLDRFTMGKFQGNHRDFMASFKREGDAVTVCIAWNRGAAGQFLNREEKKYSINELIAGLTQSATDANLLFTYVDDLPEGFSVAAGM